MKSYEFRLEEYCENCSEFSAKVKKIEGMTYVGHIIFCEHEKRCKNMINYLIRKQEGEKEQ